MQISTGQFFKSQNENLADLKTGVAKLQQQIATGKQMEIPSDNPVAFSDAARLKHQLAKLDQYGRNMNNLMQRMKTEETTLSDATNILTRIQELSIQGANDTLSPENRKTIAGEISQLRDSLLQLANVKDSADQSIFGGFSGTSTPFLQDEQGNVTFVGDTNVQNVEIASGVETKASGNGFEIFMQVQVPGQAGVKSVFKLIQDTVDQLNLGKSCSPQMGGITASLDQVNNAQMLAGTRMAKITRQQEALTSAQTQAKTMLSVVEDTDIEKVVTELKQKMLSLEASQASFVKIADLSLFNYMR